MDWWMIKCQKAMLWRWTAKTSKCDECIQWMDERLVEQVNELMAAWMSEWMAAWKDDWMNELFEWKLEISFTINLFWIPENFSSSLNNKKYFWFIYLLKF